MPLSPFAWQVFSRAVPPARPKNAMPDRRLPWQVFPASSTSADPPTAVFDVFTSQFNAATAAVGMVPDVKGNLLNRVQRALNTAVVLRNRLVKIIHQNEPPAPPAEDGSVHAHASGGAVVGSPYAAIMPGLTLLIDVELQQMRATSKDTSVPSASRDALSKAIAADKFIENRINQWWPPAPAGD